MPQNACNGTDGCFGTLQISIPRRRWEKNSLKKEEIFNLLRKHKEGLTVIEIARILKFSRNTIAVYLAELKGEGKIWIRNIGMAKLNYWKEVRGK